MNIEVTPLNIIDILSIATAFMLGLLFITSKSKNNKANVFLGLFLWSLTFEVLSSFLEGQDISLTDFSVMGLFTLPFLFLYVIKTLNYKLKPIYSLLLFPFVIEIFNINFPFLQYGFSILLLLYILKILQKHEKKLGDFYSDIENKTLSWIKTIIYIYLFFNLFWIVEDIVALKFEFIREYFVIISIVLTFLMIYWIGYNGFSQSEIFNNSILISKQKEDVEEEEIVSKVEDALPFDSKNKFIELTNVIKKDKLFLNTDIDLHTLSNQLNIKEKELSKLIKTHTNKNFYHFINQFRVEEFKQLLHTQKANQLTLIGLANEAGFLSKSTFYSAFKTSEGITPKQYQNKIINM